MNGYLASLWPRGSPIPTRDPDALVARDVCPACKRPVHGAETSRCREHGDVIPIRSHVANLEE